ncbi:MAG: hypothetical protein QM680_05040 [Luteolibacter sp.]
MDLWAYELGYAYMTQNNIEEILFEGKCELSEGEAEANFYVFTLSRRIGELSWDTGSSVFRPQMELPFTLIVVDEAARKPFLNYNFGYTMRWVDFPWNEYVKTTFAMGAGLSYSSKLMREDIDRHEGKRRSNTKIFWPLEVTFALPKYPKDALTAFIIHQSGGHIFDVGGINTVGFGYRRGF